MHSKHEIQISLYNAAALKDDGGEHTRAHALGNVSVTYFTISVRSKAQNHRYEQPRVFTDVCQSCRGASAGAHEDDENHVDQQQNGDNSEHRHRLHVQGHAAVLLPNHRYQCMPPRRCV